jgi:hypothetical protein
MVPTPQGKATQGFTDGPATLIILEVSNVEPKVNVECHHSDCNRKPLAYCRFDHASVRRVPFLFQGCDQRHTRNNMFELRVDRSKATESDEHTTK